VIALAAGALVSRSVVRRVSALAGATRQVASGDLSIRVAEIPMDEVGALGAAFNRMLGEVETSRNRIEYLSRLASWQEMARRLAHEIKNPLTPIQLAVQEVHRRLVGLPEEHRKLLDIALEIVEAEVGTLRRLVTEFSQFARLPESHIEASDLRDFLADLEREVVARGDFFLDLAAAQVPANLSLEFVIPNGPAPLAFDAQMLRRVAVNLIRNAAQACHAVGGKIRVSAKRVSDGYELCFDDDGPGVPAQTRAQVFEPYVTTKDDGTGLGLAIVKKIVMDHRGDVEMLVSPTGGARVRISLPAEAKG
jgi:nitrogen fixation/metabolism regulation signal transduction histidine kinase